jgi:hypothetical protein
LFIYPDLRPIPQTSSVIKVVSCFALNLAYPLSKIFVTVTQKKLKKQENLPPLLKYYYLGHWLTVTLITATLQSQLGVCDSVQTTDCDSRLHELSNALQSLYAYQYSLFLGFFETSSFNPT